MRLFPRHVYEIHAPDFQGYGQFLWMLPEIPEKADPTHYLIFLVAPTIEGACNSQTRKIFKASDVGNRVRNCEE